MIPHSSRHAPAWTIGAALLILHAAPSGAQIRSALVASSLQRPVFVTSPPGDQRLFIAEQRGLVRLLKNGVVQSTPFLDFRDRVLSGGLRGFLGLAFHPGYAQNGFLYVNYTDLGGNTQIDRYRVSADPDVADPGSRAAILTIPQPNGLHNGGSMAFGPSEGYLYIGMGDSGPEGDPLNNAQNPALLLGKILRIDVDGGFPYVIPPDNPFVGEPGYREEIWALGLRNPWGISFDSATGDLWTADVGETQWEEIDFQPAGSPGGENYGWRLMEAMHCFDPPTDCNDGTLTLPIYEYGHSEGRCSISGGKVYRGSSLPFLTGEYFFGDFCSDQIWSLRYDGTQVVELTEWTAELEPPGDPTIEELVGVCAGPGSELYLVDRGGGNVDGEIYRIVLDVFSGVPAVDSAAPLRLDPVFPNPSAGAVRARLLLGEASRLTIEILDPRGRRVRRLAAGAFPAGVLPISWDGFDESGHPAPAGIYFLRAAGGSGWKASRGMALVR